MRVSIKDLKNNLSISSGEELIITSSNEVPMGSSFLGYLPEVLTNSLRWQLINLGLNLLFRNNKHITVPFLGANIFRLLVDGDTNYLISKSI